MPALGKKPVLFGMVTLATAALAGCAGVETEEDTGDSDLALVRASSEESFSREMDALEARYASVERSEDGDVHPEGLGIVLPRGSVCKYLAPLRKYGHEYFYFGGYLGADVVAGARGGMDFVFDLWNRQAAVFTWKSVTANVGTAASVSAGGYFGYAFGEKANVIDAWSGRFDSAGVSLDIPETKVGVSATGFRSPDGSIVGGSLGASAGLAASWPLPVQGTLETGYWVPFDDATRSIASYSLGTNRTLMHAAAAPRPGARPQSYQYVQYERSSDQALAILINAPAGLGLVAAAQAIAVGTLRATGRSVTELCP